MAVSTANLAQVDIDANVSAAPSFLGLNTLDNRQSDSRWTLDGDHAGSDITFGTEPAQRAHQRKPWTWTSPLSASIENQPTIFFNMDLETGTDDDHTIDAICIHILNISSLVSAITVRLEFSDDDSTDFGGSPINARTWTNISTNTKLLASVLGSGTPKSYTDVRYARIQIDRSAGGNFNTVAPKLAICMMGKARRLPFDALWSGYDSKQLTSVTKRFTGEFGGQIDHELRAKQATLSPSFHLSPSSAGIDSRDRMERLYHDLGGGIKTHLYIDRPTETAPFTSAQGLWVKRESPSRFHPAQGPFDVIESMTLIEQPPFRAAVEGIDGL